MALSYKLSFQELQNRLTNVESASVSTASGYAYSHVNSNSIEVAILKGEREKRLENMVTSYEEVCYVVVNVFYSSLASKDEER